MCRFLNVAFNSSLAFFLFLFFKSFLLDMSEDYQVAGEALLMTAFFMYNRDHSKNNLHNKLANLVSTLGFYVQHGNHDTTNCARPRASLISVFCARANIR